MSEQPKVIRVGVIGSGMWSGYYINACQRHRGAEAVAVCNPNVASAQRVADRHQVPAVHGDVNELLETDIDAVAIVTPNDSHASLAIAAAKAGKHVLCEKPMAMTAEEALAMTTAANDAGIVTGINFTWRHPAAAQYARHLVESGEIGRVFHITGCFNQGWLSNPNVPLVWRLQKIKTGTGCLGDIGAHILDLAEWISGESISSVCGDLATFVNERPKMDGTGLGKVDVDDAATVLTRFSSGAMGSFMSTRYASGSEGMNQRLEIHGEKGSLIMDFWDQECLQASIGRFHQEDQMLNLPIPARFRTTPERYMGQNVTNFIDAISRGETMSPDFSEGLHNQKILDAVVQSADQRRWVDV
ncbi:MAG: gfo/Idh/MocA family oxidoreductase [Gammaproteobacteria bacterium TMED50]|nr:MAG: gfo/Idh/MocA family oxidoreductase [Gammaproteobacteria bacterium TMED50]